MNIPETKLVPMPPNEVAALKVGDSVHMFYHGDGADVCITEIERKKSILNPAPEFDMVHIWGQDSNGQTWVVGDYEFSTALFNREII